MPKATYHLDGSSRVLNVKETNQNGTVELTDDSGKLIVGSCPVTEKPVVGSCVLIVEPEAKKTKPAPAAPAAPSAN